MISGKMIRVNVSVDPFFLVAIIPLKPAISYPKDNFFGQGADYQNYPNKYG
jgi:hypothetical protein